MMLYVLKYDLSLGVWGSSKPQEYVGLRADPKTYTSAYMWKARKGFKAWWSKERDYEEIISFNWKSRWSSPSTKEWQAANWSGISRVFQDSLNFYCFVLLSSWEHSYLSHHVFLDFGWENMASVTVKQMLEQPLRYCNCSANTV